MQQIKSKYRVAAHGEVYTAEREVKAMCDLVKDETERIESRFLEPACGNGNFLAEILQRKLDGVKKKYAKSPSDYERYAFLAVTSLYGVDILEDNVQECRKRLYHIWNTAYTTHMRNETNPLCLQAVQFILSKNILCGDALTLKKADNSPIIFSEWSFVGHNTVKRRDYRLDVLLQENTEKENYQQQMALFDDEVNNEANWMIDKQTHKPIPKPIDYPITDYRMVQQYE